MKLISKGLTFVELLISIVLFSVIALAIGAINIFSFNNVFNSDRKAKVQSEITFLVEHVTKELIKADGDAFAMPLLVGAPIGTTQTYTIYQGNVFPFNVRDNNDPQVSYTYNSATNLINFRNTLGVTQQLSSRMVTAFSLTNRPGGVFREYAVLNITACFTPGGIVRGASVLACGDMENPAITVVTNIRMPQVNAQ